MICPECEVEYRDGITRCSDCDVALVNELAPSAYDEALTPLADLVNAFLVGELTDRLEKAGVPYIVEAGTALRLLDHPELRLTEPDEWKGRIWVASEFFDRARRVYEGILDHQRLVRTDPE